MQHGGPPAALLAGAAERFGDDASFFVVTRVTVELMRPIGLVPLAVSVTPLRLGRQVQWLQAELRHDERLLVRATVLRIATSELHLPAHTAPESPPLGPEGLPAFVFPFFQTDEGYHRAVELRIAEGVWGEGPCTAWLRPRFPLIAGEATSPLETVMLLADATNGIAPALPIDAFTFVNPDLSVHLRRPLEGEWLGIAARSIPEAAGVGLVQGKLFDRRGELGRSAQSLVVRAR